MLPLPEGDGLVHAGDCTGSEPLPQLKAHICGHIREIYGFAIREIDGLRVANADACDGHYRLVNSLIIIDI